MKSKTGSAMMAFIASATLSFGAPTPNEPAAVAATLEAFHSALASGEGKAAMNLLASDAVILESGSAETRDEYENHHLPGDIRFAQAVRCTRSNVLIHVDGKTAWLTSRSRAEGSFEGKPVNRRGVELAVLTKTANGWRIRAIHWSSHKVGT